MITEQITVPFLWHDVDHHSIYKYTSKKANNLIKQAWKDNHLALQLYKKQAWKDNHLSLQLYKEQAWKDNHLTLQLYKKQAWKKYV